MNKTALNFVLAVLIFTVPAFAQEAEKPDAKSVTYIEAEVSGIDTSVRGFDIKTYSIGVQLDHRFGSKKLKAVSGFSFGYRREPDGINQMGNYLNGQAYALFPGLKGFAPKLGFGAEWGYPSLRYDHAMYHYDANGRLDNFRLVYMKRNSNVPGLATEHDAILHPFVETAILKNAGPFIFEAGMRFSLARFGDNHYYPAPGNTNIERSEFMKVLPRAFVRTGVRLF